MKLLPPSAYIKNTGTPKGRGVFASRAFQNGETIEVCPIVVIYGSIAKIPIEIKTRLFNWGFLAKMPGTHALALGYGSMYNHNNPANMQYIADPTESTLHFIATRDIFLDEELTINYNAIGGGPVWDDNNWFDRMNIKPIVNS